MPVLALVALLVLVSCNDPTPDPVSPVAPVAAAPQSTAAPTSPPAAAPTSAAAPTALAEESISAAAGGTVRVGTAEDSPLTLDIPPGALAEDTTISITESPPSAWSGGMKAVNPVGPVYRLEPAGLVLAEPATITLQLSQADLPGFDLESGVPAMVLLTRSTDGGWEILPEPATSIDLATDTLTVSATISHFTEAALQKTDISVTMDPLEVKEPKGATFEPAVTAANASEAGGAYGTFFYTATGAVAVSGDFRSYETVIGPGETTGPFPEPVYECTDVGPGTYEARFIWTANSEEIDWVRALLTLGESVSAGPISGTASATGSADCVAPTTGSGISEGTTAESVGGGSTESVDEGGDTTDSPAPTTTDTPSAGTESGDGATESVEGTGDTTETATPIPPPTPTPVPAEVSHLNSIMGDAFVAEPIPTTPDGSDDWIDSIREMLAMYMGGEINLLAYWFTGVNFAGLTEILFGDTVFECGTEVDGRLVLCTDDPLPMPDDLVFVGGARMAADIPLANPDRHYVFAAVFDSDGDPANNFEFMPPFDWDFFRGTDRWYEVVWDAEFGDWIVYVTRFQDGVPNDVPSAVRVVIQGDTIVFFIPANELPAEQPGYRLTAFGHDGFYTEDDRGGDVSGENPEQPLPLIPLERITATE